MHYDHVVGITYIRLVARVSKLIGVSMAQHLAALIKRCKRSTPDSDVLRALATKTQLIALCHKEDDMSNSKSDRNKAIVVEALTGAFTRHDLSVFDRFFAENCIEHNTFIPPSYKGLRDLVSHLTAEATYEPGMIVGEGDYVMIHGRYTNVLPEPVIAVDIFRIKNGLLAEHWDGLQEKVPANVSPSHQA